jgi:hypothetical protein
MKSPKQVRTVRPGGRGRTRQVPGLRNLLSALVKTITLSFFCLSSLVPARAVTVSSAKTGISVHLDKKTGHYLIVAQVPAWRFGGSLESAPRNVRMAQGKDRIGSYREIAFAWRNASTPLHGVIRLYQDRRLLLFSYTYLKSARSPSLAFPSFTEIPSRLYHFSYKCISMAPPQFELGQCDTPWLFFDGQANAMVISPASNFIIAAVHGDGSRLIASGLNKDLVSVSAGFTQQTLMAIAPGIRHTWDLWGLGLTELAGKKRPGNEADVTLKYYGYWTDNGAFYYYKNYDPKLGYAGTLKAVIAQYREERIPVRYLQLDSWWYDKAFPGMSPDDHIGRWNGRFRGTMLYRADESLFPEGLAGFQRSLGLPLVTHNRWISRSSPYRKNYQISGVAPIDMRWWNDIMAYLKSSGVVTYEQDWQSLIDQRSPAFSSTVGTGDKFYDDMATACRTHGLTMQYCMALPCDFLEGSRYGNLTSIRVSEDRFLRKRWRNFLYTSQFAYAIGAWPWTDVFFSNETDNLLLSNLSAGLVGTGDELGKQDKTNIFQAVRADGVIVKPDVPIMPLDRMYITDANNINSPFIAATWTDDGPVRTAYAFSFSRSANDSQTVRFTPRELGIEGPVYVLDYFNHKARRVARGKAFSAQLGPNGDGYYIVAPVNRSGMVLFGDRDQFVSMGKERIASLTEGTDSLTVQLLFAPGEKSVTLAGDAPSKPRLTVRGGRAAPVNFTKETGYFSVQVSPQMNNSPVKLDGELVRRATVVIRRQ